MSGPLDSVVVVLHRPQRVGNIGSAVRAMMNMGLGRLRLVAPAEFDPRDIGGIAHRSEGLVAAAEVLPDLDSALADATFVVGTTARRRGWAEPLAPREAAPLLLERAGAGTVAVLFGPEDNGLQNEELDRCHALVTIPTEPGYASLNLAQAVLVLAYELRLAAGAPAGGLPPRPAPPRPPADGARLEELFRAAERALWDVEFFKSEHAEPMMRTLRQLVYRAAPDTREAALLTAIAREISHFVARGKGDQE